MYPLVCKKNYKSHATPGNKIMNIIQKNQTVNEDNSI